MKRPNYLYILILFATIAAGCGPANPGSPSTAEATPTALPSLQPATATLPAASAAPAPVTLDTICAHTGETAALQGILRLPEAVTCSVGLGEASWCSALLYDPYTDRSIRVDLSVSDGSQAALDHMALLPRPYTHTDFKVGTADGGLVGHGSLVSLEGKVTAARSSGGRVVACKLSEVRQVLALPELKPVGLEFQKASLVEAVAGGLAAAAAWGMGLERVELTLISTVDYNLEVTIQAGTMLEALSSEVQNMVVRQGVLAFLRPRAEVTIQLEAACASMQKKEPGSGDELRVGPALASEDLLKLLALPDFQFLPMRLRQFAVWTITDNPQREYYVGVSTSRGISEGPSGEEFDRVKELLVDSGIDPAKYSALR